MCAKCHHWWGKKSRQSGKWFAEKYPERQMYIDENENVLGTIAPTWYEEMIEWYQGEIAEMEEAAIVGDD